MCANERAGDVCHLRGQEIRANEEGRIFPQAGQMPPPKEERATIHIIKLMN